MLRIVRSDHSPGLRARFRDIDGIVVIGDIQGDVIQRGGPVQRLRLDWRPLRGHDILGWLHWKTRLVPELIGRERELASLRQWASDGQGGRARILTGEGGTGKSRLAAELAQELCDNGWEAGFADLARPQEGCSLYRLGAKGTLLIIDYPEERCEATRILLRDLAAHVGDERVRVLLLSRRGRDFWQAEIDRADCFAMFDEPPVELAPLPIAELHRIFLEARRRTPGAKHLSSLAVGLDAFKEWLEGEPANRRPLFVLAAAVESALATDGTVINLPGREVGVALVRRELKRLRDESEDAGLDPEGLPRLFALASLAGRLDRSTCRRLAENLALELGLGEPDLLYGRLQRTGRLEGEAIVGPQPDLLGAALTALVLDEEPSLAPERLWAALEDNIAGGLERFGRLAFDAKRTLGLHCGRLGEWLGTALHGRPERCLKCKPMFCDTRLPTGLQFAAPALWTTLIRSEDDIILCLEYLNNLSVHLSEIEPGPQSLQLSELATSAYRRLAAIAPQATDLVLSDSLVNHAVDLEAAGQCDEALAITREALETKRRIRLTNPEAAEPGLALCLNNLALFLSHQGNLTEALSAIDEAEKLHRHLARDRPSKYEADLGKTLSNYSGRLRESDRVPAAVQKSDESLSIFRRLAAQEPERFEADLAWALLEHAHNLARLRHSVEAMRLTQEAVRIFRGLSSWNPKIHTLALARSLGHLADRHHDDGDGQAALEAIQEAARLLLQDADHHPDSPTGRTIARIGKKKKELERQGRPSVEEKATERT